MSQVSRDHHQGPREPDLPDPPSGAGGGQTGPGVCSPQARRLLTVATTHVAPAPPRLPLPSPTSTPPTGHVLAPRPQLSTSDPACRPGSAKRSSVLPRSPWHWANSPSSSPSRPPSGLLAQQVLRPPLRTVVLSEAVPPSSLSSSFPGTAASPGTHPCDRPSWVLPPPHPALAAFPGYTCALWPPYMGPWDPVQAEVSPELQVSPQVRFTKANTQGVSHLEATGHQEEPSLASRRAPQTRHSRCVL